MSNSITGRCWMVDTTASTLTAEPTWILAIRLDPNAADDIMTLTDTAGVRIAQIKSASENNSVYQYFGRPGIFGKGVKCSSLSASAKAVIYIN